MEAPKCKLCGSRHYGMCEAIRETLRAADTAPLPPISNAERKALLEGRFDRTAYQREYMRKRRAALKSKA